MRSPYSVVYTFACNLIWNKTGVRATQRGRMSWRPIHWLGHLEVFLLNRIARWMWRQKCSSLLSLIGSPQVTQCLGETQPKQHRDSIYKQVIFFWKFENWLRHAKRDQYNMWEHVLPVRKITCHLEPLQHSKTTDCNGSPRICLNWRATSLLVVAWLWVQWDPII